MEAREWEEADESMVRKAAIRIRTQFQLRADLDDLVAAGYLGYIEARQRFDPSRGVLFSTFAHYRVRGAIIDYVRKSANLSRRAYERVRLAEASDRVAEDVADLRAAEPKSVNRLESAAASLEDAVGRLTTAFVASCLGQDREPEDPETMFANRDAASRVRAAIQHLPERERAIIVGHYVDDKRFDEIADELGVSKSWTSRMHSKALDRLRAAIESGETGGD